MIREKLIPTPKPGDTLWMFDRSEEEVVPVLVIEVPKPGPIVNRIALSACYTVLHKDKLYKVLNTSAGLTLFHDKQEALEELEYLLEQNDIEIDVYTAKYL